MGNLRVASVPGAGAGIEPARPCGHMLFFVQSQLTYCRKPRMVSNKKKP